MIMFQVSPDTELSVDLAAKYVTKHRRDYAPVLARLKDYYDGNHDILSRTKDANLSNNRVVVNHASYIADISSGYLTGSAVSYTSDEDITELTDVLEKADASTQDTDLSLDSTVYGRSFELVYMDNGEPARPKLAKADPQGAFVVYDSTVQHAEMFGVTYMPVFDFNDQITGYECVMYTSNLIQSFAMDSNLAKITRVDEPTEHFFGLVPLIEYWNNGDCRGDFENVISLIDAYNTLTSDRVNDKEQFVDSLLVVIGQVFGDTDQEKSETYQAVRRNKVLELAEGSSVQFLNQQLDESSVEILRKALKEDIHTISKVPDMSDSQFAGNVSGVAMAYKLLAFEMLARTKERFFKEGLRYRLKCITNVLGIGGSRIDPDAIKITMNRSLPVNNAELAQMIATLAGQVSNETLISQLPFVENAAEERKKLAAEQQEAAKRQDELFGLRSDGDMSEE